MNSEDTTNKHPVAIVTGGSNGIGRAIANALAAQGYSVCITGRNPQRLEAVHDSLVRISGGATTHYADRVDFADRDALRRWTATVRERFDRIAVLVHNAGIAISGPIAETDPEEWDRVFDINVRAPFVITQKLLPLLRVLPGRIVTIGSVVSARSYPLQGAYSASKHALYGFTKVLGKELHDDGIIVQSVMPGGTATDMIGRMRPDISPDDLIQPEEVADTVVGLLAQTGNTVTDEIHLRRRGKIPWESA